MDVRFVTPKNHEEMQTYRKDIDLLHLFVSPALSPKEYEEVIQELPGFLTLVYLFEVPVACFTLWPVDWVSERAYEFHGIVRQDLKDLIGRHRASQLVGWLYKFIFSEFFIEQKREKLVAKVRPDNRPATVAVKRRGFRRLQNIDHGRAVWVLDRKTYLNQIKNE
jgi:RimJ/RimL family protein N-acetyltransferase